MNNTAKIMGGLDQMSLIKLPSHRHDNGDLVVLEEYSGVPFSIARVFIVCASAGAECGKHAHRKCSQFLSCTSGKVEVKCDDGRNTETFLLDHPDQGLLVPPGIWAHQTYITDDAVLMVLCDRVYEEDDYIRDYAEYKNYRLKALQPEKT